MYKINRDLEGVFLTCHQCNHTERVKAFDQDLGSQRTQAAKAMQDHSRALHGTGSVLKAVPKNQDAMRQW